MHKTLLTKWFQTKIRLQIQRTMIKKNQLKQRIMIKKNLLKAKAPIKLQIIKNNNSKNKKNNLI